MPPLSMLLILGLSSFSSQNLPYRNCPVGYAAAFYIDARADSASSYPLSLREVGGLEHFYASSSPTDTPTKAAADELANLIKQMIQASCRNSGIAERRDIVSIAPRIEADALDGFDLASRRDGGAAFNSRNEMVAFDLLKTELSAVYGADFGGGTLEIDFDEDKSYFYETLLGNVRMLIRIERDLWAAIEADDPQAFQSGLAAFTLNLQGLGRLDIAEDPVRPWRGADYPYSSQAIPQQAFEHGLINLLTLIAHRIEQQPEWSMDRLEASALGALMDEDQTVVRRIMDASASEIEIAPGSSAVAVYDLFLRHIVQSGDLPAMERSPFMWARGRIALGRMAHALSAFDEPGTRNARACFAAANVEMAETVIGDLIPVDIDPPCEPFTEMVWDRAGEN